MYADMCVLIYNDHDISIIYKTRSAEDETRNPESNGNRNPEWWVDFSQLVKSRKPNFSVSHGTKSN